MLSVLSQDFSRKYDVRNYRIEFYRVEDLYSYNIVIGLDNNKQVLGTYSSMENAENVMMKMVEAEELQNSFDLTGKREFKIFVMPSDIEAKKLSENG